jgi:hypothetical protein
VACYALEMTRPLVSQSAQPSLASYVTMWPAARKREQDFALQNSGCGHGLLTGQAR